MTKEKDLSFLNDAIEEKVQGSRVKLPDTSKKNKYQRIYIWLGVLIVLAMIIGFVQTLLNFKW
ncbi:hypothetical protein HO924_09895 [Streptococcus suis]|nr:hypothetical protein [Streptococcus suis]NQP34834.1 hypothetical protein [Streptococcus suis]NQP36935.1 hypothetical protein [Streptococcus suis]